MTTHRVDVTPALLNRLRAGFERQTGGKSHKTVRRIADEAAVPPFLVGSLCSVKGWKPQPAWVDLHMLERVEEVLWA